MHHAQARGLQHGGHQGVGVGRAIAHAVLDARGRAVLGRQAHGHVAVVYAPVLPEARQAGGLEPVVRVHAGRGQPGQGLVVVQQPGGALARQGVEGGGVQAAVDGVASGLWALAVAQREVHMHAAAAHGQQGLGQEGEHDAVAEGHLARHLPEEHDLVHRLDGVVIGQRELELRRVVLGVHALDGQPAGGRLRPDGIGEAARVGKRAGGVGVRRGGVVGLEAAVGLDLEGEGLQFDAHHGVVAQRVPLRHGALERGAAAHRQRRAVVGVQVAHHHARGGLPARADVGGLPHRFHVGQAAQHLGPGRGDQVLVVGDAEGAAAKPCAAVTLFQRHVLAAGDVEVVAEQDTQAFRGQGLTGHGGLQRRGEERRREGWGAVS